MDRVINFACPQNAGLPTDVCATCADYDHARQECSQQNCWYSCTVCEYNGRDYYCNPCRHCGWYDEAGEDCPGKKLGGECVRRGLVVSVQDIINEIEASTPRSAWGKGVKKYAIDLLIKYEQGHESATLDAGTAEEALLGGEPDWWEYSWKGYAHTDDGDIAEALCTPSEFKQTRSGERRPNSREEWLDTQARALYQACNLIIRTIRK